VNWPLLAVLFANVLAWVAIIAVIVALTHR
jgi:hypothetical protein